MANSFIVEWTEKNKRVRGQVDIGNFDGGVDEAQREIAEVIWPLGHPERSDIKVIKVVGAGEVSRVTTPDDKKKP